MSEEEFRQALQEDPFQKQPWYMTLWYLFLLAVLMGFMLWLLWFGLHT